MMNHVLIEFEPLGRRGNFPPGNTLLEAARQMGVGLAATCDGKGTCHTCRVRIITGLTSPPTESELKYFSREEIEQGWRLGCCCLPLGDCQILIPPESMTTRQRIQLEGAEIPVEPMPSVKYFRVSLTPPSLADPEADADRLLAALASEHHLHCTAVDPAVLRMLSPFLRSREWVCLAAVRAEEVINIAPVGTHPIGLAVDMGTTKVAAYLVDLDSGETLARRAAVNPQLAYGEDIVTRMAHVTASSGEANRLRDLATGIVNQLAAELAGEAGMTAHDILDTVIVANTAIHHLLLGLPVKQLATAPYIAAVARALDIKARDAGLEFAPGAWVHIPGNIAGFVGADHTADLLAVDAGRIKDTVLLIDIGTNTEISLIHQDRITSVSCASGPAFEGGHIRYGMRAASGAIERIRITGGKIELQTVDNAPPSGLCGSGALDGLAALFSQGIIDKTGRMAAAQTTINPEIGQREFMIYGEERKISLTQGDIRELQLAKAAIRTGIQVLLESQGLTDPQIDRVIIAGAFGTYIDVESALITGLLPPLPRRLFSQVGNAAGMGAKLALISREKRTGAEAIARGARYIELATAPFFMPTFIQACSLGKYRLNHGQKEEIP